MFSEFIDVFVLDSKPIPICNYSRAKRSSICSTHEIQLTFGYCAFQKASALGLIFRSVKGEKPEQLLGDFKRFTSKAIVKAIQENRKEILWEQFKKATEQSSNVKQYQFWRHDNKPIELWSNKVIREKVNYVHLNPVEAGLVYKAEEYVYSSTRDYAGEQGLLDNIVVFNMVKI